LICPRGEVVEWETKTVLITVKTYPNPSTKYIETVCCAGVDINSGQWVRLYPIPFRYLEYNQKFPKYSIVKVKCHKSPKDKRVESYRVAQDSIEIVDHLDTKNKWGRRKEIVLPATASSFCEIQGLVSENKSLGVFKPCNISFS
jgi:hypothetical protein